jgi:hypothetical protein
MVCAVGCKALAVPWHCAVGTAYYARRFARECRVISASRFEAKSHHARMVRSDVQGIQVGLRLKESRLIQSAGLSRVKGNSTGPIEAAR